MVTRFRIAHVSDLHLAEKQGDLGLNDLSNPLQQAMALTGCLLKKNYRPWMTSYQVDYLRALAANLTGSCFYNKAPYDGFVFSGDIATTGLQEDMAVAAAFIRGQPIHRTASTLLSIPPEKVVVAPGNHDRYFGRTLKPTSAEFERPKHFGENWTTQPQSNEHKRSHVNARVLTKNGTRLGIVCADFSYTDQNCPWLIPRYLGGGKVEPHVLSDLVNATKKLQDEGTPCIWVTHHAPISRKTGLFLRLKNAQLLGDAANDLGVRYILCGHTHYAVCTHYAKTSQRSTNRVRVICAGTATSAGKGDRVFYDISFNVNPAAGALAVELVGIKQMRATKATVDQRISRFAPRVSFRPYPALA